MTKENQTQEKYKVLVVDDDENAGRLAETHLKKAGYEAVYAPDGETAIKESLASGPDAILLDLRMPGIDGFEVCSRLKAEDQTKDIPIIILSSQRERNQVLKALEQGADDFIVKPLDAQVMLHKLKSILPQQTVFEEEEGRVEFRENREFVRLSEVAEATIEVPLEIVDISEGGMALVSESRLPVGKILLLNSPLLKEVLEMEDIPIRISYSVDQESDHPNRLGAEFVGLPESARKRIRQYIFKKQTERVKLT